MMISLDLPIACSHAQSLEESSHPQSLNRHLHPWPGRAWALGTLSSFFHQGSTNASAALAKASASAFLFHLGDLERRRNGCREPTNIHLTGLSYDSRLTAKFGRVTCNQEVDYKAHLEAITCHHPLGNDRHTLVCLSLHVHLCDVLYFYMLHYWHIAFYNYL